ncbi:hypothetical protein [Chryseobacterium sp. H1D6B]|uniref:hypothetical protein n=1 Tax=Chryseobacterium sp. H1D6B TaxID=2940588 RepID=UPI0015C95FE7|nr:hypothetical protein [Chryseobacterium sp. H1D6B]
MEKLVPGPTELTAKDSISSKTIINDTIKVENISKQESEKQLKKALEERKINIQKAKKEYTYNFYGIVMQPFKSENKRLSLAAFSNLSFYPYLALLLFFVSTISMLVLSFFERIKAIRILGILNLLLLITSMVLYYASEVIEDLNQIKIGFYVVFINTFLIIIFANRIKTK